MIRNLIFLLVVTNITVGCGKLDEDDRADKSSVRSAVQSDSGCILSYEKRDLGILFEVDSGGCTEKATLEPTFLESYPPQIQLVRIEPDLCKANVEPVAVFFTYEELLVKGDDTYTVRADLTGEPCSVCKHECMSFD